MSGFDQGFRDFFSISKHFRGILRYFRVKLGLEGLGLGRQGPPSRCSGPPNCVVDLGFSVVLLLAYTAKPVSRPPNFVVDRQTVY